MAITVALKTRDRLPVATPLGYEVVAEVTFDTNYAASGGEALDSHADLLLPKEATVVHVSCSNAAGFFFDYDKTTEKLIAYVSDDGNPGAEAAAGDDGLASVATTLHVVAAVV